MKRTLQQIRQQWLFSLQGKFIMVASVCAIFFTTAGGLMIISRDEALYRQDLVNQGKVIAEVSRLMLTNVLVYNELGMMADRDLNDFLDYYIIELTKRDKRIKLVEVIDTKGTIIACSDISRCGELSRNQETITALGSMEINLSPGRFETEPVINIAVPLNISSKSWGGLRIVLSAKGVDVAIASLRKEIFSIALLFSLLSLLIVWGGARILARPVTRLSSIMDGIKNNVDLEQVEAIHELTGLRKRRDEIGTLQNSFLWMVQRLRDADREHKKAMETLVQTEKMVSIGRLASGVAHEINNPLGGIAICFKNLVKLDLDEAARKEHIEVINDSLQKIGNIVGQLLHFSRMTVKNTQPGDINDLIGRILLLLNYRMTEKGIRVKTELAELPLVMMDEHMIGQVLINILINALQAMTDNGFLTIRTEREEKRCVVTIEDTGPGIPADVLPCIFEPFFTTKSVGDGTGLGLSISKSIIEQHGGEINVESQTGHGARFIIRIPLAQ